MKTSILTLTLAIGLMASGSFAAVQAEETTQPAHQTVQTSTVSQQTKSDLADWRAAGFDPFTYDRLSYNIFGAEYQHRYAKYQELRKLHGHQLAHN